MGSGELARTWQSSPFLCSALKACLTLNTLLVCGEREGERGAWRCNAGLSLEPSWRVEGGAIAEEGARTREETLNLAMGTSAEGWHPATKVSSERRTRAEQNTPC